MFFFTSDTHFGHDNIIRYCNRPFESVEEMDRVIISNWNKVVGDNDTVYHLGDFSFKDPYPYRKSLKGKIVLIQGNHDFKRILGRHITLFESIHDLLSIRIEHQWIVLCHYALAVWDKSHFGAWHLFGHSHGSFEGTTGKTLDVGVDSNAFTPVSFEELKLIMEVKPDNRNLIKNKRNI